MRLLIKTARDLADDIVRTNVFFKRLKGGELDDMRFVYGLRAWCGAFIDSLFLAAATCTGTAAYRRIRREHAVEEGRHPGQLDDWMLLRGMQPDLVVTTPQTVELSEYVREIARSGSPTLQVLVLNVLMEYMALVTFKELIAHFGRDVLHGKYWHVHEEVDEIHSMMGTTMVDQSLIDDQRLVLDQQVEHAAYLMDKAIASWSTHGRYPT